MKTAREKIADGPKFVPVYYELFPKACAACGFGHGKMSGGTYLDRDAGLCLECWRAWRFGARCADHYPTTVR